MIEGFDDRRELLTDWQDREYTLLVALSVEVGEDRSIPVMLDIACEYCVISDENAKKAGWSSSPGLPDQRISTRLGLYSGCVDRMPVKFVGVERKELIIDATWIIIEDWPGPTVLGWRGCLERMLFAFDPLDNWFYFATA